MSTLDALRQAVLASPDDDLPRLVYADYLEENDDPDRAAFIRAQVELAKTPEYEPFAVLCKTRQREWVTGGGWLSTLTEAGSLRSFSLDWSPLPFRRGFGWAVDARGFPNNLSGAFGGLLACEPVGELRLGTTTLDKWRQFSALPCLVRIHSLAFTGISSPNEPLRCLRESPHTTGVTSLRLETTNYASIPIILEDLFAAPLGKQLTSLAMRHGYGSVDETIEGIAQNGPVSLTEFDLFHMGFGPSAARALVDSGIARQTDVLRLSGNPLMQAGMAILTNAAHSLRILDLTESMLDAKAVEPLAQSPAFAALRKLVLTGNHLSTDGIKMLARSPHLAGLRSLGLANTHCDNAAVRYLTRGLCWPNLVELDLRNNPISDTGAKNLLTARPAPELTSLVLPTRNLTDDMRAELTAKFGAVVSWVE